MAAAYLVVEWADLSDLGVTLGGVVAVAKLGDAFGYFSKVS